MKDDNVIKCILIIFLTCLMFTACGSNNSDSLSYQDGDVLMVYRLNSWFTALPDSNITEGFTTLSIDSTSEQGYVTYTYLIKKGHYGMVQAVKSSGWACQLVGISSCYIVEDYKKYDLVNALKTNNVFKYINK